MTLIDKVLELTSLGYEVIFFSDRDGSVTVSVGKSPDGLLLVTRSVSITHDCIRDSAIDAVSLAIDKAKIRLDEAMRPPEGVLEYRT